MSPSVNSNELRVSRVLLQLSSSSTTTAPPGQNGGTKSADQVLAADNFDIVEAPETDAQNETATFKEVPSVYRVDISAPRDSTFDDGHSDNVALGNFLSRPTRIFSDTWSVGYTTSNYNEVFDPWTLWQSDARIKQKLANFTYASFDLKLRFVMNGSPFQYGNMLVIYIPYGKAAGDTDPGVTANQTASEVQRWYTSSSASGRVEAAFQHFSTYPHAYLNPTTNQVVEMTLPFMWHNNSISLNGTAELAKETLGMIQMYDINPLRIANTSAPLSVNFTCYAWAENLKLSIPTEFTPTSSNGKRADEFNDGPVSSIASSVAKAAGMLTGAPVIGKFAKASQIGAGTMADVARLFGFSAPAMVENPSRVELKMHGRMANTSGEDSSCSLSLDPKQEITVDPSTVGVAPSDEMTIKSLVTREQFLARCEWSSGSGQFTTTGAEEIIFASLVNPNQIHRTGTGTVQNDPYQAVMDHPAGWLANMFQYWKGSVTYRVEVVCTKMHSGRLKIQFDPFIKNGAITVADVNTEDVNARYTMILDLQEATATEFTINWNNRRPWLRTRSDNTASTFEPFRTDQTSFNLQDAYDQEVDMGMFVISVVNELVAPIATDDVASATHAPVQVNVYVKMGEDMQFAQPSENASDWSNYTYRPSSSAEEGETDMTTVEEYQTTGAYVDEHNNDVFFGESIVSIRSLIKRYTLVFTGGYGTGGTTLQGVKRMLPYTPAYVVDSSTTNFQRRNSYLSYLMPGFLIARGSIRYKLNYWQKNNESTNSDSASQYSWAQRTAFRVKTATIGYPVVALDGATSEELDDFAPHGYNGICFTEQNYQPVLELQVPWYSNTRYMLGVQYRNVQTDALEQMVLNKSMTQVLAVDHRYTGIGAAANVMQQWHAAGDDFSLHFFTGVPMTFFLQPPG